MISGATCLALKKKGTPPPPQKERDLMLRGDQMNKIRTTATPAQRWTAAMKPDGLLIDTDITMFPPFLCADATPHVVMRTACATRRALPV